MQMDVVDGLLTIITAIENSAITVREAFLRSNFGRGSKQMSDQFAVIVFNVVQGSDWLAGNDKHVSWCLWINVPDREAKIVLVDKLCRYLPILNFLKKRLLSHLSVMF